MTANNPLPDPRQNLACHEDDSSQIHSQPPLIREPAHHPTGSQAGNGVHPETKPKHEPLAASEDLAILKRAIHEQCCGSPINRWEALVCALDEYWREGIPCINPLGTKMTLAELESEYELTTRKALYRQRTQA